MTPAEAAVIAALQRCRQIDAERNGDTWWHPQNTYAGPNWRPVILALAQLDLERATPQPPSPLEAAIRDWHQHVNGYLSYSVTRAQDINGGRGFHFGGTMNENTHAPAVMLANKKLFLALDQFLNPPPPIASLDDVVSAVTTNQP